MGPYDGATADVYTLDVRFVRQDKKAAKKKESEKNRKKSKAAAAKAKKSKKSDTSEESSRWNLFSAREPIVGMIWKHPSFPRGEMTCAFCHW